MKLILLSAVLLYLDNTKLCLPTINCMLLHIQNTLHLAEKALSILYNNS